IHLDDAVVDAHRIGGELLAEGRGRAAVGEAIFVAVPGASDASVDDASLPDRPVLVRAHVGERADGGPVAEHRNALAAGARHDARRLVGNRKWRPYRDPVAAAIGLV